MIDLLREGLRDQWRILREEWLRSADVWRDPVRQQFERAFWAELEETVVASLAELERLAEVIEETRHDIETP